MERDLAKELDSRCREFYEFVMPTIDIIEEGDDLIVTVDLHGFVKKDINLRIVGNVLYITAKREQVEALDTVYYRHRPLKIDKRVLLPISFKRRRRRRRRRRKDGRQADVLKWHRNTQESCTEIDKYSDNINAYLIFLILFNYSKILKLKVKEGIAT